MQEIQEAVAQASKDIFNTDITPEVSRTDEKFGDYATNAAMQLAGKLGKSPREIAEALAVKLQESDRFAKVEVAGPGFINIFLKDQKLIGIISDAVTAGYGKNTDHKDQQVVIEYSDPNPFKVLHAGHLYTSVVGDAIANLFEAAGARVHRVNFGGDVGMHVAKTLWSILKELAGPHPEKLQQIEPAERSEWLAKNYVAGNNAYDEDEAVKPEIIELNKKIYQIQEQGDKESALAQIYWTTRDWSYEYFNQFYERIGTHFERFYPESEMVKAGVETVRAHIGDVFEQSDGAVVFKGEKHGLHTRVFINSEGLPTYEAKDVGLILRKWQDYQYDRSVIITGNEQQQYLAVVLKAVEQFEPELSQKTSHLTHGIVKLAGGVKMSSRLGNILRATDILDAAAAANKQARGSSDPQVTLGAVKYSFLKHRTGADIVYDPEESVSLVGNSGPYLQYAHARARGILKNVEPTEIEILDLQPGERTLIRKISEYPEVIQKATDEMMPHHIATYLYELAQVFNRFYEDNRVVGDARESTRLNLVKAYANVLKSGLGLLNIEAPQRV
jgi:arginyl-tRNA synthetase